MADYLDDDEMNTSPHVKSLNEQRNQTELLVEMLQALRQILDCIQPDKVAK